MKEGTVFSECWIIRKDERISCSQKSILYQEISREIVYLVFVLYRYKPVAGEGRKVQLVFPLVCVVRTRIGRYIINAAYVIGDK